MSLGGGTLHCIRRTLNATTDADAGEEGNSRQTHTHWQTLEAGGRKAMQAAAAADAAAVINNRPSK